MKKSTIILLSLFLLSNSSNLFATVHYVKTTINGTGDGSSWSNASNDLQMMINTASNGDEIWVSAGVYIPIYTANTAITALPIADPGNVSNAFVLKVGIKIYGGFAGTELNLSSRNWRSNMTTLSGQLNGTTRAYHVFIMSGSLGTNACLDGFTITGGKGYSDNTKSITVNANTIDSRRGAGIYITGANASIPTIRNLIITGNESVEAGGGAGIYCGWGGNPNPRIENVIITNNTQGSGVRLAGGALPTFINCLITKNTTSGNGGGIVVTETTPIPTIINSTIADNSAVNYGGIFTGNAINMENTIVWGNTGTQVTFKLTGSSVNYCLVQNTTPAGTGNLNGSSSSNNPLFIDTSNGNYQLTTGSASIDKGNNTSYINYGGSLSASKDLNENSRLSGGTIDLGAYESFVNYRSATSGAWSNTANWLSTSDNSTWSVASSAPGATAGFVTISNGHELNVTANTTTADITINPGGKLTLNSGYTLTSGILTLQSNATGTATFVDKNTSGALTATSVIVDQYLSQGRNWYVGSPITSATNDNLISAGANSVSYYNESASGWVNNYTGALTPGLGYIAVSNSGTATNNISFNGSLNSGEITIPVTNSGTSYTGFNLLGNPYTSYLNSELFFATNIFLRSTIWYRTKESGSYTFQTFNAAGNVSVPASTSGYIPPMQGFWVRANSAGSVTFANTMRSHGDGTSNPLKAPNVNKSEGQLLRLEISNGVNTDETVLYFNSLASNGYDDYDSPKKFNNIESYPEIYSKIGNEKLVINGLAEIKNDIESPLGFTFGQAADLKLKVTELTNIGVTTKVYLLDKSAETETELQVGTEYVFNTGTVSNNESRFSLLFKVQETTTGFEDKGNDRITVFVDAQNEIVILSDENMNYSVFNGMGQKITEGLTDGNRTVLRGLNKRSIFILKMNGLTKKIIL